MMMMLTFPITVARNVLSFIQRYGWTIVFSIMIGYIINIKVIQPKLKTYKREKSYREATNPDRVRVLSHDMARIRQRQQEENKVAAIAAKEEHERKKIEEMKRKRIANPSEVKRGGRALGYGTNDPPPANNSSSIRSSYNPMSPGTSNSSASSYRPNRRNQNVD